MTSEEPHLTSFFSSTRVLPRKEYCLSMGNCSSGCNIQDNKVQLRHDKFAVAAYNRTILDHAAASGIDVRKIHFFSDGAGGQFKNGFNLSLVLKPELLYGDAEKLIGVSLPQHTTKDLLTELVAAQSVRSSKEFFNGRHWSTLPKTLLSSQKLLALTSMDASC